MNREISESFAKNTTIMLAAQSITWVASFVLLVFLPRYLGSEDYGRLYLAVSMGMMISIVIDFGGNYLIPKEVAKSKEKTPGILVSYLGVRTILWLLCMGCLLLFSYLVDYSRTVTLLILILGISKLWEGGTKAIRSCFQGYEKMEYPSLGVIAEQVFVALFAVSALLMGAGSLQVALIMAVGAFINMVICAVFLPRIVRRLPKFRIDTSVRLLKQSLPYFMWSIFAVIYYRIDAVMLSVLTSDSVVGWYGGAYRFFDIVMFLPVIITTVAFPIFSRLQSERGEELATTFQKSLKFVLMAAIPVSVLFFFFSEQMVSFFYGLDEYGPSVIILQIFSLGILLIYVDFILGSAILATDRQRAWAFVGFSAILLNIGLNYLMIPYTDIHMGNGGIGAAISTLITELFIMIAALLMLTRNHFRHFDIMEPVKAGVSGILMAGAIWMMNVAELHWVLQAAAGTGFYLILVRSLKVIRNEEIEFLEYFFTWEKMKSILPVRNQES